MIEVADFPIQTVAGKLKELAPALRALGVKRLSLFGSRARGDVRPDGCGTPATRRTWKLYGEIVRDRRPPLNSFLKECIRAPK